MFCRSQIMRCTLGGRYGSTLVHIYVCLDVYSCTAVAALVLLPAAVLASSALSRAAGTRLAVTIAAARTARITAAGTAAATAAAAARSSQPVLACRCHLVCHSCKVRSLLSQCCQPSGTHLGAPLLGVPPHRGEVGSGRIVLGDRHCEVQVQHSVPPARGNKHAARVGREGHGSGKAARHMRRQPPHRTGSNAAIAWRRNLGGCHDH